jgi:hypothetical protein
MAFGRVSNNSNHLCCLKQHFESTPHSSSVSFKKCKVLLCSLCSIEGYICSRSWGSSVSIVSDYGQGDRGSIPGRGKGFFLWPLCPDRLWGPPSFLYNGYRGSFPWGKARPGRDTDHSPTSSAEVKNE